MYCSFTGLSAFEHEGIQNITALKDQLIAAKHDQTPAILKRHADVIARFVFINFFLLEILKYIYFLKKNLLFVFHLVTIQDLLKIIEIKFMPSWIQIVFTT